AWSGVQSETIAQITLTGHPAIVSYRLYVQAVHTPRMSFLGFGAAEDAAQSLREKSNRHVSNTNENGGRETPCFFILHRGRHCAFAVGANPGGRRNSRRFSPRALCRQLFNRFDERYSAQAPTTARARGRDRARRSVGGLHFDLPHDYSRWQSL